MTKACSLCFAVFLLLIATACGGYTYPSSYRCPTPPTPTQIPTPTPIWTPTLTPIRTPTPTPIRTPTPTPIRTPTTPIRTPTPTVKAITVSVSASQFLAPHNIARRAVGVQPLEWDARLERYAQWWAGQRSNDCQLEHSTGPYGENLFWGSGTGWAPAQAVSAWVEEGSSYELGSNSCTGMCGHYTQIVWRDTQRIGCASVTCSGDRGTIITCNYDPPGNYLNQRPY